MSSKFKIGIRLLLVVIAGLPLACKAKPGAAGQSATETSTPVLGQTPEQKVLDRFLGNWSWEVTTYSPGSSPEEKHATGRSSYARVLGGNFVEEMGEDSEGGSSLVLYIPTTNACNATGSGCFFRSMAVPMLRSRASGMRRPAPSSGLLQTPKGSS